MRKAILALATVVIGAGPTVASALSADSDMAAWASASAAERSELADQILSKGASGAISRPQLLSCLDEASRVSGHRQLPIGEVAEACLHPTGPGDQAGPGDRAGNQRGVGDPRAAAAGGSPSDARDG